MAKKVVATLKKVDSKVMVKAYKLVRNPKTGAYSYKTAIINSEEVANHFANKEN